MAVGLQVTYNLSQPEGSRIQDLKIRCRVCEVPVYEDLDENAVYPIAVNSFMVTGGDGYTVISENLLSHKVGLVDIDAVQEYLKVKSPIIQEIEGRIQFVGSESVRMLNADLF